MKTSTPYLSTLLPLRSVASLLVLPLLMLLAGLMMACSHGNVGTKSVQTNSQSPPPSDPSPSSDKIYTVVEQQPEFPGGTARLAEYMHKNLRYPEPARRARVEGRAFVNFTITKEGNIKDLQLLKGLGFGTNEEAIRLVQAMPNWRPGVHLGQPVDVKYNIVVRFDLGTLN
jgi:protein TonB